MDIEILEQKTNFLKIILHDTTPAFANSLRRTMLTECPVLAIEEVIILENTSPLYDEIIAHRLGLIPLKTDLEVYNLPDACTCEGQGCPACEVSLMLDKEGDKDLVTVYSRELIPDDPKVVPVIPDVPILKMSKNQRVSIQCIARLGLGKNHARFQPVSTVSYKYKAIIEIDNAIMSADLAEEISDQCPKKVFAVKNGKLKVINNDACTLCNACTDIDSKAINIIPVDSEIIFFIESTGALDPITILKKSLIIIKEKAVHMNNNLDELVLVTEN